MKKTRPRKLLSRPDTKARILTAAQEEFSEKGYDGAGIRGIAARAGVSSTLLLRYFGSKANMYEAALASIIPTDVSFAGLEKKNFGKLIAGLILNPAWDLKSPAMVAMAIGDSKVRETTIRVTEERVIKPLAEWLGPPHAEARALEIMMISLGFLTYARRLPVIPHVVGVNKEVGIWFASSIQAIVDRE